MTPATSVTDRDTGRTLLARLRERHWRVTRVRGRRMLHRALGQLTREA
ncbi:hypothetical protein [Streptomyces sp. NPDC057363]